MTEEPNPMSRNPNVCASCSSLADGMDEPELSEKIITSGEAIEGAGERALTDAVAAQRSRAA